MKPVLVLAACFLAAPSPARALPAQAGAAPPAAPASAAAMADQSGQTGQEQAHAETGEDAPRRSRMLESDDKPAFKLSALYRVSDDPARKDHCLKGTGTRLKREARGEGACTIGNGQVFVPER